MKESDWAEIKLTTPGSTIGLVTNCSTGPGVIDTKRIGSPFISLRSFRLEYSKYDVFLFLKIVPIFANSEDPDEMLHFAAFHLGLHCLPQYPFMVSSIHRVNII